MPYIIGTVLDKESKEDIMRLQIGLDAEWIEPEYLFISYRALSPLDPVQKSELIDNLDALDKKPFSLTVAGTGMVKNRSLIAQIDPSDELAHLHMKLDTALRSLKTSKNDPLLARIELGNAKKKNDERVAKWLSHTFSFSKNILIKNISLIEYTRTSKRFFYSEEKRFNLTRPDFIL